MTSALGEECDPQPLLFAGECVEERNVDSHAAKGVAPMETAEHWEKVYATKRSDQVSWYQPHLDLSLRMIADVGREHPDVAIIDVGGGESTLVDDLFARGYTDLTVLDLSKTAIEVTKQRIGADAGRVTWLHGDVTTLPLPERRFGRS